MPIEISVILCTCNRSSSLKETLRSLEVVSVPAGVRCELLVVDNNSRDDTRRTVDDFAGTSGLEVRYLFEGRQGLSHARNSGLAHARGELLLFIDDDVIPARDWLEQMVNAFHRTQCDAVVGKVELAPHLLRPWLTDYFKRMLAVIDFESVRPVELVGANMGFRRSVLERVHGFDPELGAGALGVGEETLFGWQLVEAGLKIAYARHAVVVHHPDLSRLRRSEWLRTAAKFGKREAYLQYHWEHTDIRVPRLLCLWFLAKLRVRRILQPPPPIDDEVACPQWETSYVRDIERCRQFRFELKRPRNYVRRGLVKRSV